MPYLFQASFGPVQSFIAGARRTRDLKFGSWFLSEISRAAAQAIARGCGEASLIFPALTLDELMDTKRFFAVPNKILAAIELEPKTLANKIELAVHERVKEISNGVYGPLAKNPHFNEKMAMLQVEDLLEYTWVAVPYDGSPEKYSRARKALDAVLAAHKNMRRFKETTPTIDGWEIQPKSSLDGQFESVISEKAYPRHSRSGSLSEEERSKAQTLRKVFGAGPHEKLSGVDLLKRMGKMENEAETFPSTSHIAALPFLFSKPLKKGNRARTLLNGYVAALESIAEQKDSSFALDVLPQAYRDQKYWDYFSLGQYDGALLFPERLPNVIGDIQAFRDAKQQFQQADKLLQYFFQHVQAKPDPYYALLVADGDSMGEAIEEQAKQGMKQHQALSRKLTAFADEVTAIVKKHMGVCIYAGGDDVMAFLPLHEAVQCAQELAKTFHEMLEVFPSAPGSSPTLSVGMAIVHHLHPLWDALDIARAAEKRAKKLRGKNALAITLQKRGGPPCEIGGKWDAFDRRLLRLNELCQQEIIPTGMAYELEEIALRLDSSSLAEQNISPAHVQHAALRVFKRKLSATQSDDEGERKVDNTILGDLREMIGLTRRSGKSDQKTDEAISDDLKEMIGLPRFSAVRVGQLAKELVVAHLCAQAQSLALGATMYGGADHDNVDD